MHFVQINSYSVITKFAAKLNIMDLIYLFFETTLPYHCKLFKLQSLLLEWEFKGLTPGTWQTCTWVWIAFINMFFNYVMRLQNLALVSQQNTTSLEKRTLIKTSVRERREEPGPWLSVQYKNATSPICFYGLLTNLLSVTLAFIMKFQDMVGRLFLAQASSCLLQTV